MNLLGVLSKPRLDEVFFVSFPLFKGLKNNIWYNYKQAEHNQRVVYDIFVYYNIILPSTNNRSCIHHIERFFIYFCRKIEGPEFVIIANMFMNVFE